MTASGAVTERPWRELIATAQAHLDNDGQLSHANGVELLAALKRTVEALEPFAEAWKRYATNPDLCRHLSMAQLGELAAHDLSGVHYQRAALATGATP